MGRAWVSKRDMKQKNMEVPSENSLYYLCILYWDHSCENQSHCVMLIYMDVLQNMQILPESLTLKHNPCFPIHCTEAYDSLFIYTEFNCLLLWIWWSYAALFSFLTIKKFASLKALFPPGIMPCGVHIKKRQKPECAISLFLTSLASPCMHFFF